MNDEEIREMLKEMAGNGGWKDIPVMVRLSIGRIISHLESEQRVARDREKELQFVKDIIKTHDLVLFGNKDHPEQQRGIIQEWIDAKRVMETNRKIHMTVLTAVLGLVVKAVWEIITKHP